MTSPDTREERHTTVAAWRYRLGQLLEIMRTEETRSFCALDDDEDDGDVDELLVVPVADVLDPLP